ncbi:MAG: uroporphyrinogen-III C-methyltransferase [Alphaproteobacteria bacterium]|nr:uroporphyrinogen-III C-methyltransferase [Alphaproteobacteria bacterium]
MDLDELSLPQFEAGWVWLVGAGPGDPSLLTVGALHALRSADTVVHDALVDERILALAHPEAGLVYAGKRGGKPSPKQPDISARLVTLAREGRKVLRLKGGDPFLFGRGGEEALALVASKIPFRVIPGITAAVGGLAYAGIPMTHRATATAVTFVTGHNFSGNVPDDLDWSALANGAQVLIFYMALKHIEEIVERLLLAGRAPDTPAALIADATTARQKIVETCLADAAQAATNISPPALFVVGEVVRLRSGLDWLGALSGKTLEHNPLGLSDIRDAG